MKVYHFLKGQLNGILSEEVNQYRQDHQPTFPDILMESMTKSVASLLLAHFNPLLSFPFCFMNLPSPSKKWHLLVLIHSISTPIYLLLLVINIQFGAWIKIIASSLVNIINRFLHFWTKLSRNKGEQYPKTSNKIMKGIMLEGFPILSTLPALTCPQHLKTTLLLLRSCPQASKISRWRTWTSICQGQ